MMPSRLIQSAKSKLMTNNKKVQNPLQNNRSTGNFILSKFKLNKHDKKIKRGY